MYYSFCMCWARKAVPALGAFQFSIALHRPGANSFRNEA